MARLSTHPRFPRFPLFGALTLIALTMALVVATRVGIIEKEPLGAITALESRDLRFTDTSEGGIAIYEGTSEKRVGFLPPGTNSFVRATLRGLAHERQRLGLGPEQPFRLTRWADGRVSLEDLATGQRIHLEAFGPTNMQAFATILDLNRSVQ